MPAGAVARASPGDADLTRLVLGLGSQDGQGSMCDDPHIGWRGADDAGNLGVRQVLVVAQHQDRPLLRLEPCQVGPARLSFDHLLRRILAHIEDPRFGVRNLSARSAPLTGQEGVDQNAADVGISSFCPIDAFPVGQDLGQGVLNQILSIGVLAGQ